MQISAEIIKQHPKIGNIPELARSDLAVFCSEISAEQLKFMEMNPVLIEERLNQLLETKTFSNLKEKHCLWLAIAFGHLELSDACLIYIAHQLSMSIEHLFLNAAMAGKVTLIITLAIENNDVFNAVLFQLVHTAVRYGHLTLFDELIQRASDPHRLTQSEDYQLFTSAACWRQHVILQCLFDFLTIDEQKSALKKIIEKDGFFWVATKENDDSIKTLQFLLTTVNQFAPDQLKPMLRCHHNITLSDAGLAGRTEVVKLILAAGGEEHALSDSGRIFYQAERHNLPLHPDILNGLLRFPKIFEKIAFHHQYFRYTNPFAINTIAQWREQAEQIHPGSPQGPFYLLNDEAQLGASIAIYLTKRNDRTYLNDIQFLLNIPSVFEKVRQEILSTAIACNNEAVIDFFVQSRTRVFLLIAARSPCFRNLKNAAQRFPSSLVALDCSMYSALSLENLELLKGAFRYVRILYLGPQTISEIRYMTDSQCSAFKDIFLNLQKIMPRVQSKSPVDEANQVRRIAEKLGLSVELPSLQSQCVFFAQKNIPPEKIPKDNRLLNCLLSGQ